MLLTAFEADVVVISALVMLLYPSPRIGSFVAASLDCWSECLQEAQEHAVLAGLGPPFCWSD